MAETRKVWIIESDEYPESGGGVERDAVYASLDAAVESLKSRFNEHYAVEWLPVAPEDGKNGPPVLSAHFDAVRHYSTKHVASWVFLEVPIVG